METDSTKRFADRVTHYTKWRPSYPAGVTAIIEKAFSIDSPQVVADLGSGTGISSRLFLERGDTVYGVEPNREMREEAERLLGTNPRFHSVAGTAESTTLSRNSCDGAVSGQAFHWFDQDNTRRELLRILRPSGWCVLIWNTRKSKASQFMTSYEDLLRRFGTDYQRVSHENLTERQFAAFFRGGFTRDTLPNTQTLTLEGVKGRLLSTSYAPKLGEGEFDSMMSTLEKLFERHQQQGVVPFVYETEVYCGRLAT